MQKLQDALVRAKSVLVAEVDMEFKSNEDFEKFVKKWTDRYQLTLTPKERFKRKKKGHPTFDLVIHPNLIGGDAFTSEMLALAKERPELFQKKDFDFLNTTEHYLPMKFFLFCNIDSPQIYDGSMPIDIVNKSLKSHIEGCENFIYVFDHRLTIGKYELVRLTQKRSIRDELEGREKNAFDWTWRIIHESYSSVQSTGEALINRWNQYTNKSEEEKTEYFEKHLRVLESYYGFRGVRKQVGTLWAKEKKLLKTKYGEKALRYYRSLNLNYVQRLKSSIEANIEPSEMIQHMQKAILQSAK